MSLRTSSCCLLVALREVFVDLAVDQVRRVVDVDGPGKIRRGLELAPAPPGRVAEALSASSGKLPNGVARSNPGFFGYFHEALSPVSISALFSAVPTLRIGALCTPMQ